MGVVRIFRIPNINFNARTYCELVSWRNVDITEPPLMKQFSNSELKDLVDKGNTSQLRDYDGFRLPCHTQAVERCVKLVTETSLKVAGDVKRDGYIRAVFTSRSVMPTFITKKQYKNALM